MRGLIFVKLGRGPSHTSYLKALFDGIGIEINRLTVPLAFILFISELLQFFPQSVMLLVKVDVWFGRRVIAYLPLVVADYLSRG